MNSACQDIRGRLVFYLDDELQGNERVEFESHLNNCETCRTLLENERRFLALIRQSRPLHRASPELRARVESLVNTSQPAPIAPAHLRDRIQRSLSQLSVRPRSFTFRLVAAGASIVTLLIVVGVWRGTRERRDLHFAGPSEFALMAADTHLRHLRGQLPLEIVSAAPQQISSWFENKLSFSVKLPNYQESSGQEKLYELEGARLVGYQNDYAAYVSYQMRQRPISLVITSSLVAKPAGGEEVAAKGLTFHYDSINGLKVITWSDRGLTYALVSDLEERGQQSCVVCHHGTKDQDAIDSLRPKS
jgi:anti-sigma factor RsiW